MTSHSQTAPHGLPHAPRHGVSWMRRVLDVLFGWAKRPARGGRQQHNLQAVGRTVTPAVRPLR